MLENDDILAIDKVRQQYIDYYKEGVITATELNNRLIAVDEVRDALEQVTDNIISDMAKREKTVRCMILDKPRLGKRVKNNA